MPFLDHLEELRWRILWSLAALVVGMIVGFFLVERFDVLSLLKAPIEPYLAEGKLYVTRPTDAFFLTLKLAFILGVVIAAPVVLSQVWAFLAPALYDHEKRYIIPALIAGTGLFVAGVLMAYLWVLPAALKFLLRFQRADLEPILTANEYLGFSLQFMIAFGLVFQLPLFMVLLSAIGLVGPATYRKYRPYALVVGSVVAALVTPPDPASMLLMLFPLIALYEIGILVARLVWGKRAAGPRIAALLLLGAALWAPDARAQDPRPRLARDSIAAARQPGDSLADSLAQAIDTAAARRLGLPTQPSRSFPPMDSVLRALLELPGYRGTRYAADSITLFGPSREIRLTGAALVEREGSTLEADTVSFRQAECSILARGGPTLFEAGTVLVGGGMSYDTCERRGIVASAITRVEESGVPWFLRGDLGVDSASTRVYGAHSTVTSCDLPVPHYHFGAGSVKWVSRTLMVARPAVLYVRDVPILWLPFIAQDMRVGRRSGLLVPRFGFSDLIRPNEGYQRQVSNIGLYLAINDYTDAQITFDWFSGNYKAVNGQLRYRWLNRFLSGGLGISRVFESPIGDSLPGGNSMRLQWNHSQSFDLRTRFTANVDYATSARVIQRNAIDPLVQTATLDSRATFSKQFDWATLSLGGSRSQDLSNGGVSQTLPNLSLTPVPIDIGSAVTWSPSLTLSNMQTFDQSPPLVRPIPPVGGVPQSDSLFPDARTTRVGVRTPFRIGSFNWSNDVSVVDFTTNRPREVRIPDPDNPADTVTRFLNEDFRTEIDWSTGINLPTLFASTWKLQPSVGVRNATSGPFLLKNAFTGGRFVSQGKRVSFGASMTPTVFGFFPGFGPVQRIRHAFSPVFTWSYAPAATVPEDYARAQDPTRAPQRESPVLHAVTASLFQTFEAKLNPPPGDTTGTVEPRKLKLLTIQTSSFGFDFVQAKEVGRTGWTTQRLTNRFTSDLLPGFTISTAHDMWDGVVGFDTTRFSPFLESVSARFSVSDATIAGIVGLLTGRQPERQAAQPGAPSEDELGDQFDDPIQPPNTGLGRSANFDDRLGVRRASAGFRASVSYDERRFRQPDDPDAVVQRGQRTVGFNIGFNPTDNWAVSWNTQYDFTSKEFGQHVLRLDRDLHRWRATFAFVQAPNGNVSFNFFVSLLDQPEIQFRYDQRTVQ